jgi:HD superfamily phosphodiesterase
MEVGLKTLLIEEVAVIVEAACASPSNAFGYGIWTHHIQHVVRYGRLLAQQRGADSEIVELAALLHDYAGVKDFALYPNHHIHGPIEAEKVLSVLGYPPEKIAAVKYCIANHRGSVPGDRQTLEAQCLADADAMAHIGQVPSLMRMVFVERGLDIDEGTRWVREKLERSWQKLSAPAQAMMREYYTAALKTLSAA